MLHRKKNPSRAPGHSFAWQKLQGADFRRLSLSGADFTGADLRSARFQGAELRGASFAGARLGRTRFRHFWIKAATALVCGLLVAVWFAVLALLLDYATHPVKRQMAGVLGGIFTVVAMLAVLRWGLERLPFTAAACFALLFGFMIAIAERHPGMMADDFLGWGAAVFGFGLLVSASVVVARRFALQTMLISITLFVIALAVPQKDPFTSRAALFLAGGTISLYLLALYRRVCSRPVSPATQQFAAWLAAVGGTSFMGADLTGASFSHATIHGADFRTARLSRVCWRGVQGFRRIRVTGSALHDARVEELLVTGRIATSGCEGIDLRGVNLDEANLEKVCLRHADLTGASLRGADLSHANLAETMCVGADFTNALLTGACIESWNIDAKTVLDGVLCEYVYLREEPNAQGHRERRPHDPEMTFGPGDFARLYQRVISTVEILLRGGVPGRVFNRAFEEVMTKHPEVTHESIRVVERKGQDLLLRMEVPDTLDKGLLEHTLRASIREEMLLEKNRMLEDRITDLRDALALMSTHSASIVVGGNVMGSDNRSVRIAGNVKVENSGNLSLSGDVTHTVVTAGPSVEELRRLTTLLTEVETRLADDPQIDDRSRALAHENLKQIALAASKPADTTLGRIGQSAMASLRCLVGGLPALARSVDAIAQIVTSIGHTHV